MGESERFSWENEAPAGSSRFTWEDEKKPEAFGPEAPKGPIFDLTPETGGVQIGGPPVTPNVSLTRMLAPGDTRLKAKIHLAENVPTGPETPFLDTAAETAENIGHGLGNLAEQAGAAIGKVAMIPGIEPGKPIIPQEAVESALGMGARGPAGPVRKGLASVVAGATTPGNVLMAAGIGKLPGWAAKSVSAIFSASQMATLARQSPEFRYALEKGDIDRAIEIGIPMVATGAMGLAAGLHAGTPSPKLAERLPDAYTASREATVRELVGPAMGREMLKPPSLTPIPEIFDPKPVLLELPEKSSTTLAQEAARAEAERLASPDPYRIVEHAGEVKAEAEWRAMEAATRNFQEANRRRLDDQLAEIDARAVQRQLMFPNEVAELAKLSPELALEREAVGVTPPPAGYSGEIFDVNGKKIEKLNPPDHVFREAAEQMLGRPGTAGAADAVENLRPFYGLEDEKIQVKVDPEVDVASTKKTGDTYEITLPENPPAYQIVHEVTEIAKELGDRAAEPYHDNNAISAEFLRRTTDPPIAEIRTPRPLSEGGEQALADYLLEHPAQEVGVAPEETGLPFREPEAAPAGKTAAAKPPTTMEFGMLGAPQIGKELVKVARIHGPEIKESVEYVGDIATSIGKTIDPTHGLKDPTLVAFRSAIGKLNHMRDVMYQIAIETKASKISARMTEEERVRVLDWAADGRLKPDHPLSPLFRQYRVLSDILYEEISKLMPDLNYLDNRISARWKVPPRSTPEEIVSRQQAALKPRSLVGDQYWKNERKWKSLAEGIKNGGVLRTTDIVDILVRDLENQTRFWAGNKLWEQTLQYGDRTFVPDGTPAPEGWKPMGALDQRFTRGWVTQEPGKIPGSWYLSPDAWRVMRNYLSSDPFRRGVGSKLINFMNSSKAIVLLLPTFHASNIAQLGMGVMGMSARTMKTAFTNSVFSGAGAFDPIRFVNEVGAAMLVGPGRLVQIGNQVRRYFKNPEEFVESAGGKEMVKYYPELAEDLSMFYDVSGARLGFREQHRKGYINSIIEAYNRDSDGYVAGALFRSVTALPQVAEFIGGPLFGRAIPQAKVATWLVELQDLKLKYGQDYASGRRNIRTDASNLWNSVENRFGMVDYDLRLWHRVFKTIMQMTMLSFGWRHGTAILALNAVWKPKQELARWIDETFEQGPIRQNRKGEFKPSISFAPKSIPKIPPETIDLFKVMATIGITNSMIQMSYGNPVPAETDTPLLDMVFPRTKGYDEDGKPNRWRFYGSYGPALYGLVHDPIQDFKNGLSPAIKQIFEAAQNRRWFSGEEVYNENDPWLIRWKDAMKHAAFGSYPLLGGEQGGPIVFQSWKKGMSQGRSPGERYSVVLGGGPAPRWATNTEFENSIDVVHRRMMPYSKTPGQASQLRLETEARDMIKRGADPAELMSQLSSRARKRVLSPTELTSHQRRFAAMPLKEALNVWDRATPDEKAKYVDLLRQKVYDVKTTVSRTGAVHVGTGMEKMTVWEAYPASEIPILKDRLRLALAEGMLAKNNRL